MKKAADEGRDDLLRENLDLKSEVAHSEDVIRGLQEALQGHEAREEAHLNEIKLMSEQLQASEAKKKDAPSDPDTEKTIAALITASNEAAVAVIAQGGTAEEAARAAASAVKAAGGPFRVQAEAAAAAIEVAGGTAEECGAAAAIAARLGGSTAEEAQTAAAKAAATSLSRQGASLEEVKAVAISAARSAGASERFAQQIAGELKNDDWDKQKAALTAGLRRYEEMIQDLQVNLCLPDDPPTDQRACSRPSVTRGEM